LQPAFVGRAYPNLPVAATWKTVLPPLLTLHARNSAL
jgi:hypothetical protein